MQRDRLARIALTGLVLVVIAVLAIPYARHLLFAATSPRPIDPRGDLADFEKTTITLFERASPAVVQVVASRGGGTWLRGTSDNMVAGTGTGFLWDSAGNIVTNAHVVAGTRAVAIRTALGDIIRGEVAGVAPNYDIAVIRVLSLGPLPQPLPLGSSADLKVGQAVFAIGNPFGLDQSLTTGVISALKRRLPTAAGREIAEVIQTDAAINPGNSGGPLLDSAGRVIGINTAIFSPSGAYSGIGFAIPIDTVNRIVPELIQKGRVPTPGIGIVAANEDAAARVGREGIIIIHTIPGLPADRAGLRAADVASGTLGDVIVAVQGKPVYRLSDLTDILAQTKIPGKIQVTVERDGVQRTVSLDVVDVSKG